MACDKVCCAAHLDIPCSVTSVYAFVFVEEFLLCVSQKISFVFVNVFPMVYLASSDIRKI